jgi:ABC-type nitrate/sulfonate/bicarbonate transport system substrate-binding protein
MFWLAAKKGFFDEVGLDVQPVLLRGSPITIQALVSESLYLALGSADSVIAAAASGADLLGVGGVAVGGGNFNLAALTSGQLGATYLVVPLDYTAEQQGFNVLGYFKDYFPNFQLSLLTVKRGWAEKNRALLVRYLKATVRTHRWLYASKEAAIDFLAKEIPLKPELARRGWEYYTANRIWHPNAEIALDGLKIAMQIYGEQFKSAPPDPLKYIDLSYLQQAIKELGPAAPSEIGKER